METNNARTKRHLEGLGFKAITVTEYFDKRQKRTHDLFGFADLIATGKPGGNGTLYVQTTDSTNHAARRTKILNNKFAWFILASYNRIAIVSWKQSKETGGWVERWDEITIHDMEEHITQKGQTP